MKIHQYSEMMKYLTRPKESEEGGVIGGGMIEGEDLGSRTGFAEPLPTDVQDWLKETFPNANLNFTSDRKYGILKKENANLYQTIERAAKQKQKNKEFVYKTTAERNVERTGKQSIEKIKEKFKKNFLEKKVDKPTYSKTFNEVKFKNKKQEEQYIKLLKDKYSKPASGKGSITNAEIAKKFNVSDYVVENINSILSKKLNLQYPKSKAFYEAQGKLTPQQQSLLEAIEKRKIAQLELQGRKFPAVKESGKVIHHIMPLGGKEKITAQGLALIDDEMNRAMIEFEKPILKNARRIKEIYENQIKYGNPDSPLPKNIQEEIKKINMENRGYVELAKKKLPKNYRGLIGYYEYEPTDLTQPVKRKGINPNLSVVGIEGDDFVLKDNPKQSKQLAKQIRETTADIAGTKELQQIKQLQSNIPVDDILRDAVSGRQVSANPFMQMIKVGAPTLPAIFGPTGIAGLTYALRPEGGYDLSDPLTRAGFELEAALAPTAVKGTSKAASYLAGGNQPLRRGIERLINLGMRAPTALKVARIASPIGILSLGAEGAYQFGKALQEEKARIAAMSPEERQRFEEEQTAAAYMGEAENFATGGRVGFEKGGSSSDKKKTTPALDKPTIQIDPNAPTDPGRRDFMEKSAGIGALGAAAATGLIKFGPEIKKAVTGVTTQIDQVPNIIKELYLTIKQFGKQSEYPKPGSGNATYEFNNYKLEEGPDGYNITRTNDRGDFYPYSEENFEVRIDPEKGVTEYDEMTLTIDVDGKLKDTDFGIELESYGEIGVDLARIRGDDSLIKIADEDIAKQIEKEEAFLKALQKKGTGEND